MKILLIFLFLTSFMILTPMVFGSCISLPCDDANITLGEPNYRFIDFSFQNKVGEPIKFILEKTAKNECNSYIATITNENGKIVWEQKRVSLCVISDSQSLWTSQIKLGFDASNPIIPLESARYLLKVQIDDGSIEREFVARNNYSGFSIDRTVYPVPWKLESPLKQTRSGIPIGEIQCIDSLVLMVKYDGSPACVTYHTGEKLVKRGWASCDNEISYGQGNPCGTQSGTVNLENESSKIVYPKFEKVTEIINPEHQSLKYRDTSPIIDDTYLSKNVQQWTDAWDFELQAEYEKYGDEFYTELGKLMMKNEIQYQMDNLGIVNTEDDFNVIGGLVLTSLPPHIGFSSIVHATDGYYYWLQGMAHSNQVSYFKTTQLQYPDPKEVDFDTKNQEGTSISILPKGDNDLQTMPSVMILTKPGDVEFNNETPGTLTVYLNKEGDEEFSFEDSEQISIPSFSADTKNLEEPGSYSWHGEVPTIIEGKEYDLNTGGGILVLSDNMTSLSKEEQMETARMMLIGSGLPIGGIGQRGEEDTLYLSLSPAINELLPESKQYYLERAKNLIPFNISIQLDEPVLKPVTLTKNPIPDSGSLFIPPGHELGDAHVHGSILVKIFGDKFDFSHPQYQIRSSWIHFEALDGNTIHRHSKGITLGYLFDTLSLKLSSDCFVFVEGREFCTNQDYSLKFFINGEQTTDVHDYVINQGDRILVSYGSENIDEIQDQLEELNAQEIIS